MLTHLLAESGLVGLAGERFNHSEFPDWARRRPGDYLVHCAVDANGTAVFGIKLHRDQLERFLGTLRSLRGSDGSDGELVAAVFPEPRYVHLRREDAVAQGVSWWKARTSGSWRGGREPRSEPVFDFDGIDERVRRVREHDREWAGWMAANGISALELTYEQVVADPVARVRETLSFLDLAVPDDLRVDPRTERQSDEVNEEWIRRYVELSSLAAR
jgi:trehalose 2-sulfotransferase